MIKFQFVGYQVTSIHRYKLNIFKITAQKVEETNSKQKTNKKHLQNLMVKRQSK